MNEFLRNFVMTTITLKMIDNNVAEWQVRELALDWYTKGVLTEEDLQTIVDKYKEKEEKQKEEQEQEQEDTIQIPLNEEESESEAN